MTGAPPLVALSALGLPAVGALDTGTSAQAAAPAMGSCAPKPLVVRAGQVARTQGCMATTAHTEPIRGHHSRRPRSVNRYCCTLLLHASQSARSAVRIAVLLLPHDRVVFAGVRPRPACLLRLVVHSRGCVCGSCVVHAHTGPIDSVVLDHRRGTGRQQPGRPDGSEQAGIGTQCRASWERCSAIAGRCVRGG